MVPAAAGTPRGSNHPSVFSEDEVGSPERREFPPPAVIAIGGEFYRPFVEDQTQGTPGMMGRAEFVDDGKDFRRQSALTGTQCGMASHVH